LSIDKNIMRVVKITDSVSETKTVKTLIFKDELSNQAKPGQFLMVWIPRKEEIPLSVMISSLSGHAAVTIRKIGFASTSLFSKRIGDYIGIRGPYGNSFSIKKTSKNIVILGGGTGLVPLVRLIDNLKVLDLKLTIIIGARTKDELFFVNLISDMLKQSKFELLLSTEDGTTGIKGYPTDILNHLIMNNREIDVIYTCGPELMMKKVYELAKSKKIPLEASLERYMKCGIGLCSSCSINDKLVCVDGTVFNETQISNLSEFGVWYRNKSGILDRYEIKEKV
jgi:dihydroorotate dehydrogenase electron transfer subunit